MEIKINGRTTDVTLDNEKTVGEIMAGIEKWLANSGHRLSGLSIDGQAASPDAINDFFSREIDSVKTLDIYTSSVAELTSESLLKLIADIEKFETLKFDDKNSFFENWKESTQAKYTAEQMPDLYSLFVNSFSGGTINARDVLSVTQERLREVNEPQAELGSLKPLLEETCARLEKLPLDLQTGKDSDAAQTIQFFSGITDKILRILTQLNVQGLLSQDAQDNKTLTQTIGDFLGIIKNFQEAYEKNDTVLVGDIAEYEASPMLKDLYSAILENIREQGKNND